MNELKELIKKHEGLRLKLYRCPAGKLTIGYGRNLEDKGISEHEADMMLESDIAYAKRDLLSVLDDITSHKDPIRLTANRFYALVDRMFNLGLSRFKGFKKMIKAIEENDWDKASKQALDSRWAEQVKSRAIRDALLLKEG